ncbi:hypothetical protein EUGRSUZ_E02845 [Eucalyptus grandis]|uniref:Uncharacterized protein n=2 Tax=Eucalyptus grandis TaxID=71139 RepID=A0ACC3KZU7_EUCGR|nr:hypothetical protein EUGRSUZ_E02845 [Eucalyptus grandis]
MSESTNSVFQQMSAKISSLVLFVHYYEEQLKHIRETEGQDDYSSREQPKLHILHNEILTHATSMYTYTIFKRFYDEFLQTVSQHISSTAFNGLVYEYTLKCKGIQGEHTVRFNPIDFSVSCECKFFESKGWLCQHALYVLNVNSSVSVISFAYILKIWTKGAKQEYMNDESHEMSAGPSTFYRFSILMQNTFEVMSLGVQDENIMK